MAQRGIGREDLQLIEAIGSEVEGGYLVREKDFQVFERELKQLLDHVRKLVGKRIVLDGDHVITAYHAGRRKQRRLLRHAECGAA
jgi:hypothetical protein